MMCFSYSSSSSSSIGPPGQDLEFSNIHRSSQGYLENAGTKEH